MCGLRPHYLNRVLAPEGEVARSFLVATRKDPKKRSPDGATSSLRFAPESAARQLAGRIKRATGSNTRLAFPDSGCDARARHTGN